MKVLKFLLALAALFLLAACSSTDEHGVKVDKKFLFFGCADTAQSNADV